MRRDELNKLSKDELINIIENFESKDSISDKTVNYHALLEATSDIVFVIDTNEKLVYRNEAHKELYPSLSRQEIGLYYMNYLPDVGKERAEVVFETVVNQGKEIRNELMKTIDSDGKVSYYQSSFSTVRAQNGKILGLVGIMKNITKRHLAQKALKENHRILEERAREYIRQSDELKNLKDLNDDIIKNAPVGMFMMDPSGVIMHENPELKKIMGRNPAETIVGFNILHYKYFTEGAFGSLFDEAKRTKKTQEAFNMPYVTYSSNKEIIINATAVPILDKNENVEKVLMIVEDHTEQAKINERMNRAEKLSALGVLSSGVASELRNYINKMVMDLNFIENNIDEDNPAREYVYSLNDEMERIKSISEQLISLAAIDEEDKEIIDINKIIKNHPVDVLLKRCKEQGYAVNVSLPHQSPTVKATPNQIQQILIQFLKNAQEAMKGKGTIALRVESIDSGENHYVTIKISDTGIGIPEEKYSRIFQPFFTTKGKNATGLGLMIASSIIENLNGSIGIKSAPGEGASFKIILPAHEG